MTVGVSVGSGVGSSETVGDTRVVGAAGERAGGGGGGGRGAGAGAVGGAGAGAGGGGGGGCGAAAPWLALIVTTTGLARLKFCLSEQPPGLLSLTVKFSAGSVRRSLAITMRNERAVVPPVKFTC